MVTRSAEPLGGRYVTSKLEHGRQVVVKAVGVGDGSFSKESGRKNHKTMKQTMNNQGKHRFKAMV